MKNGIIIFLLICIIGGYIIHKDREKILITEGKSLSDYYAYKDPEHVAHINARNAKEKADTEALRLKNTEPGFIIGTLGIGLFFAFIAVSVSSRKESPE